MKPTYRIGIANDTQPDDPSFDTLEAAIERAQQMANLLGYNTPVAVWDDMDPLYVFFLGEQFRKV